MITVAAVLGWIRWADLGAGIDTALALFGLNHPRRDLPFRGLYADGNTVVILFDTAATARDGVPYHNTYIWILSDEGREGRQSNSFLRPRDFDEFWTRVSPKP